MASEVDVTFPADGEKVSKSEMRAQWQVIKDEIEALQRLISLPGRQAFDDRITEADVIRMISLYTTRQDNIAFQIAFGTIDVGA